MNVTNKEDTFEARHSDNCTICGQSSEFIGGGIMGTFGSIPVTFCQLCLESIVAMVQDITGDSNEDMYI